MIENTDEASRVLQSRPVPPIFFFQFPLRLLYDTIRTKMLADRDFTKFDLGFGGAPFLYDFDQFVRRVAAQGYAT
tara:strand:+ start:244 stop:468 length:225 start_codon:yes stop_codon:yes gene_type:complete